LLAYCDVTTTLAFYAKSRDAESRTVMDKLEEKIRNRPSGIKFGSSAGNGTNGDSGSENAEQSSPEVVATKSTDS
jgi:hypothetical protein